MFNDTFKALLETFKALAGLPTAIVGEIIGLFGKIIHALENVIAKGVTEEIEIAFTLFGRRIGIKVRIWLLDATEGKV